MMINVDVNTRNKLIKIYATKDLFGILVIVSMNVINHVMLVGILTMKSVIAGRNSLIN